MMKYIRLAIFPFLLLVADSIQAQSAAEAFAQMMASFTSVSGGFTQSIYAESGDLIDRQQGQMSLQKPRLIRWETATPRQLMICDGDSIYLYDPDLEQVVIRPWRDDPTQNPVSLFTSDTDLSQWFSIHREAGAFVLESLRPESLIGTIKVLVSEAGLPTGFRIEDQSGQVSEIAFENVKFDQPMPASNFVFQTPPGVDVIVDD
jgi:outer membrane lipoprotein carrier protein